MKQLKISSDSLVVPFPEVLQDTVAKSPCSQPRLQPTGRLLVLDDDQAVGQTIAMIAERTGLNARATTSAEEFFVTLGIWEPTHIALDLVMPDIDGIEILRELGERNCGIPIIITSGVGSRVLEAAQRSAREHGLNIQGILAKPFAPSKLRALLVKAPARDTGPCRTLRHENGNDFKIDRESIHRAIEDRQFHLVYQPKIHCADGRIAGFEALVRWQHPTAGLICPDRFIPLAEQSGMIGHLTSYIFEAAISWFATTHPDADISLSLNVSARSLDDINFADELCRMCRTHGLSPGRVILEVTETSATENSVTSLDLLARLRLKGFNLSIDDFGVGHSTLVQLARLPFSELKIDKSFVITAQTSRESLQIIRSVIRLGHSLGLRVTAEGVEDEKTLRYLRESGCDLAQGYFIARPMRGGDVSGWIAARG